MGPKPVRAWGDRAGSLSQQRRADCSRPTKDRLEIESLRTRSAAHPSGAAGGLPGISEIHQQGLARASVPRLVRSPAAAIGLGPAGDDRWAEWPGPLLCKKSDNMTGPLPFGESGLFPLLTGRLQNRGGRAEELKGSKALGHFCEQSDLGT